MSDRDLELDFRQSARTDTQFETTNGNPQPVHPQRVLDERLFPTSPLILQKQRIGALKHVPRNKMTGQLAEANKAGKFYNLPAFNSLRTSSYAAQQSLGDWEEFIHPEGNTYYKRTWGKFDQLDICLLTEDDVYGDKTKPHITKAIETLEKLIKGHGVASRLPRKFDAYIGIVKRDKERAEAVYYFIDHATRSVFWAKEVKFDPSYYFSQVAIESEAHLQHVIDYYYWIHVRHFPSEEAVSSLEIRDHLNSVLLYGCCDTQGTSESNYPFDSESMKELYDVFQEIKKDFKPWKNEMSMDSECTDTGTRSARSGHCVHHFSTLPEHQGIPIDASLEDNSRKRTSFPVNNSDCIAAAIAQYMIYFTKQRVFHRFGESNARVSHLQCFKFKDDQKWYGYSTLISGVLLFAPQVYYRELKRTFEDLLTMEEWKPFFEGVKSDWTSIVINAAVLLNANIAFLAIPEPTPESSSASSTSPSSSPSSAPTPATSPSTSGRVQAVIEIASQLSMILSLSSMIVGLSLLKQSGSARAHSENELYHFIKLWGTSNRGLYAAAIKFSIPYILLMYSTIAFVVALTTLAFTSQLPSLFWMFLSVSCVIAILSTWAIFAKHIARWLNSIFYAHRVKYS